MKHAKQPGDNKEMVKSRTDFLNTGHYSPISNLLNKQVLARFQHPQIGDIGCGNGYYLNRLKQYLDQVKGIKSDCWGIDISKEAIQAAAKQTKEIHWIVSNIAELPFASHALHSVISVFSPLNFSEFYRVLDQAGYLFIVYPSKQHLYELRQILFNEVKNIDPDRILQNSTAYFSIAEQIALTYSIDVTSPQELANLFSMTPYYWRCTPEKRQAVLNLKNLTLTIDVILWVFKKNRMKKDCNNET